VLEAEGAPEMLHATATLPLRTMPNPTQYPLAASTTLPFNFSKPLDHPKRRTISSLETEGASRNSSLQKVWAEDYYAGDFEGDSELEIPAPAARTERVKSLPLCVEETGSARQPRTHQRSLTALLPSFRSPRSKSKSPERRSNSPEKRTVIEGDEGFMPTLTGDREGAIKAEDRSRGGLTSWLTGSPAPVPVEIPNMEQENSTPSSLPSRDASPERALAKSKKRPTLPSIDSTGSTSSTPKTASTSTSRFSFFMSPKTPSKPQNTVQLPASLNDDEYLTLDISSALFPTGSPSERDSFSPSAFKNLLTNAEGLLCKLQTAYKLRTLQYHDLIAESAAQNEELEEAQTRVRSLRSQLEDIAAKFSTQDTVISDLVTQLAEEKRARAEEREAREKSIALVKANAERGSKHTSTSSLGIESGIEDLGIRNVRNRHAKWGHGSVDMSGDSDAESLNTDSVFSRSRSPTLTAGSRSSGPSVAGTVESTPEIAQASFARVVQHPGQVSRPKTVQQKTTFQRILTGLSGAAEERDRYGGIGMGESGCENCRGKDASVAWDTVGLLRAENRGLKDRVGCLESAVEGALDLCDGLHVR
jgi:hypothetical protein